MRQLSLFDLPVFQENTGSAAPAPAKTAVYRRRLESALEGGMAPEELQHRLGQLLKLPLHALILTNNRTRIISSRPVSGDGKKLFGGKPPVDGLELRIHRCFVHASAETLKYVAEFVNGARGADRQYALSVIREHFESHRQGAAQGAAPRPRRTQLDTQGQYFDLVKMRDEVNRVYFDSAIEVKITWGRTLATHRKRRKRNQGYSVRLGSYHAAEGLIRIHRSLDGPDVPHYVVESVIYHEMLHAVIPPVIEPGRRRQIHPPEFRRREREYPEYEAAELWLADNLARLAGR